MKIGVTLDNFHAEGTFPDEKEELKRAVSLVQSGAEQALSNMADLSGPIAVLVFKVLIALRTSEASHDKEHSSGSEKSVGSVGII